MTARELYARAVQYLKSLSLPPEIERGVTYALFVVRVRLPFLADCITPEDLIHSLVLVYLWAKEEVSHLPEALRQGIQKNWKVLKYTSIINKEFYRILKECGFRIVPVQKYEIPSEIREQFLDEYIQNGQISKETKKVLRQYRRKSTKVVFMTPVSLDDAEEINFISEQEDEYAKPRRKYQKEI